jgi:hypothetical protein
MRIRVKDILDLLAEGPPRDQILADYPYLEDRDITAALDAPAPFRWQPCGLGPTTSNRERIPGRLRCRRQRRCNQGLPILSSSRGSVREGDER